MEAEGVDFKGGKGVDLEIGFGGCDDFAGGSLAVVAG